MENMHKRTHQLKKLCLITILNAPLLEAITVLCDVALLLTMVVVGGLSGGAILVRSIIGFLTLLILLGAEDNLILVLRTILTHMVHKLRVL